MDRKGPLDAYTEADLADGECLAHPAALPADHHALKDLDARTVALDDADVDLQRVAGPEVRYVRTHRYGVNGIEGVHRRSRFPRTVQHRLVPRDDDQVGRGSGGQTPPQRALRAQRSSSLPYGCGTAETAVTSPGRAARPGSPIRGRREPADPPGPKPRNRAVRSSQGGSRRFS